MIVLIDGFFMRLYVIRAIDMLLIKGNLLTYVIIRVVQLVLFTAISL